MPTYPPRAKVPKKYRWNAESVFADKKAWEQELVQVLEDKSGLTAFEGRLASGAKAVVDALTARDQLMVRAARVYMYAAFANAVDTTDKPATEMLGRATGMIGQVIAAAAFIAPELIAMGEDQLRDWMSESAELAVHRHALEDLFRKHQHIRSAEVEQILGMLAEPFSGPQQTANLLTNADMSFKPALNKAGRKLEVTQSSVHAILGQSDRAARQSAWNNYMDRHVELKNTLASNLATSVRANVFASRVRKHEDSLSASLFDINVPTSVFHNLLETFRKRLPVWHRYFEIRRKALGLREIGYYDMWAPLGKKKVTITYEQAVGMICDGLAPLGTEYTDAIRRGCGPDRWVDSFPNKGKQNGAFSYGAPGTHPFIMMSYTDDVSSLSTLAHELGHSMHSYLTWKHQPLAYADYSLFVAEVASNFHQAMVRHHLLTATKDKNLQVALIEEAMSNFFRYFFQMPTLARFELEIHRQVERGEAPTADGMNTLMADLFTEGFGPKVKVDRPRVGMVWSTFGHLFMDYYVYSYATGISGAHALSSRILRGEPNAVPDYLGFLQSGSSRYAVDVLKSAGVDLTTPRPVEETFDIMEGYINRLEELTL